MKNRIKIFIVGVFILSSCAKKEVNFQFCNDTCNVNEKVCFIMKNNTEEKYAFLSSLTDSTENGAMKILILDEYGIEPKTKIVYLDKLFPNDKEIDEFLLNEKKDSLLWKNFLNMGLKVDFFWVKQYNVIKKNSFVLDHNADKKFFKNIIFLEKQLKNSGSYYIFEKNKKYTIQAEIDFDSVRIKKYLTKIDLDSLKRNNIKIFHGKLKTEKIPLLIEN